MKKYFILTLILVLGVYIFHAKYKSTPTASSGAKTVIYNINNLKAWQIIKLIEAYAMCGVTCIEINDYACSFPLTETGPRNGRSYVLKSDSKVGLSGLIDWMGDSTYGVYDIEVSADTSAEFLIQCVSTINQHGGDVNFSKPSLVHEKVKDRLIIFEVSSPFDKNRVGPVDELERSSLNADHKTNNP